MNSMKRILNETKSSLKIYAGAIDSVFPWLITFWLGAASAVLFFLPELLKLK